MKALAGIFAALTIVAGCSDAAEPELAEETPISAEGTTAAIDALERGEVVISIDEMPNYGREATIARDLRAAGVTATVFVVGERLGTIVPREGSSYGTIDRIADLRSVLENGHLVANHTYSHPIAGAAKAPFNPAGRSYASLLEGSATDRQQAVREVVWTQQLILQAIKDAGGAEPGRYAGQLRRWFRPSGGSWNGSTSPTIFKRELGRLAASDANFSGFEAPIGWHVPVPPQRCGSKPLVRNGVIDRGQVACRAREGSIVDWECHSIFKIDPSAMSASACAENYLNALGRVGEKGVVLFHGNLDAGDYSRALLSAFVTKVRARVVAGKNVRIVHPDCAFGSRRAAAVAAGLCR